MAKTSILMDLLVSSINQYNRTPGDIARYNYVLGVVDAMETLGMRVKISEASDNEIFMIIVDGMIFVNSLKGLRRCSTSELKLALNAIYGTIKEGSSI